MRFITIQSFCCISAAFLLPAAGVLAASPEAFGIVPGPTEISPEEAAIHADPGAGLEHAVILVQETAQDDGAVGLARTRHHLRAKVLSSVGRGLADIKVTIHSRHGRLEEWWGRTIQPDGTVQEVPREALVEMPLMESGKDLRARVISVSLPGVVPGSVIDYGYEIRDVQEEMSRRIEIQKEYPVRKFRFEWIPAVQWVGRMVLASRASLIHDGIFPIEMSRSPADGMLIEASDVPPLVEEPFMPPDFQVRASALLYYTMPAGDPDEFWDKVARWQHDDATRFTDGGRKLYHYMRRIGFPEDATKYDKLKIAYDWLQANLGNIDLQTYETTQEGIEPKTARPGKLPNVTSILDYGHATAEQLDWIFLGMARALKVEARLVLTSDRTIRPWSPSVLSWGGGLEESLVAVRMDEDTEGRMTLVDPGSGLPFGEVPWWLSGTLGLMISAKGADQIKIGAAGARNSASQSRAGIAFDAVSERASVSWTMTGRGQRGLLERRTLRRLHPAERRARIRELCGERALDVIHAEAEGVERLDGEFEISCRGEFPFLQAGDATDHIVFEIEGPWIQPVPAFTGDERIHDIVFDFPKTDLATLEVSPPEGFVAGDPPEPIQFSGPFGHYFLQIERQEGGFLVQRSLTLPDQHLPRTNYGSLKEFLDRVSRSDSTSLTFLRRTSGSGPGP